MKLFIKVTIFFLLLISTINRGIAQVDVEVNVINAPPPLPEYAQPPCPYDGYIWSPGYWAYNENGYYWVPGVWVSPPQVGVLWTPGYWYFNNGFYRWRRGYWGHRVGYYGGVRYGFGYFGVGFVGGMWRGNRFHYNTAVVNVNKTVVRNVYVNKTVIKNTTVINNRSSYNGPNGSTLKPTAQEELINKERHIESTNEQEDHEKIARTDKAQYARENNGKPTTASMDKFNGDGFDEKGNKGKALRQDNIENPHEKEGQKENRNNQKDDENKYDKKNNELNTKSTLNEKPSSEGKKEIKDKSDDKKEEKLADKKSNRQGRKMEKNFNRQNRPGHRSGKGKRERNS